MNRRLYMICPTDHLESVINDRFNGPMFFYTSLGNTVAFTEKALGQIAELIEEKSIKEITFILSEDNNILQDALNSQSFVGTRGLYKPYSDFLEYKKQITEIKDLAIFF